MVVIDHYLWFYSTCAQTFAALVSIFGMFVLYRLQIEEGRIGHLREQMMNYEESHHRLPLPRIISELTRLEKEHRGLSRLDAADHLGTLLADYEGATEKRRWLALSSRAPIVVLIALVLAALTAILAMPFLIENPGLAGTIAWSMLLTSAYPLIAIAQVVFESITND